METELKEQKELVLKRVPPGDRWVFADGSQKNIYQSLTDALEGWYQENGDTVSWASLERLLTFMKIDKNNEKMKRLYSKLKIKEKFGYFVWLILAGSISILVSTNSLLTSRCEI